MGAPTTNFRGILLGKGVSRHLPTTKYGNGKPSFLYVQAWGSAGDRSAYMMLVHCAPCTAQASPMVFGFSILGKGKSSHGEENSMKDAEEERQNHKMCKGRRIRRRE
jgi:hypothetical protein